MKKIFILFLSVIILTSFASAVVIIDEHFSDSTLNTTIWGNYSASANINITNGELRLSGSRAFIYTLQNYSSANYTIKINLRFGTINEQFYWGSTNLTFATAQTPVDTGSRGYTFAWRGTGSGPNDAGLIITNRTASTINTSANGGVNNQNNWTLSYSQNGSSILYKNEVINKTVNRIVPDDNLKFFIGGNPDVTVYVDWFYVSDDTVIPNTIETTLNSPSNNAYSIYYPQPFNITLSPNSINLTNATIKTYLGGSLYSSNSSSVTGTSINSTLLYLNLNPGIYNIETIGCGINTSGGTSCFSDDNVTLNHGIIFNNYSYNASTYETAYENYFSSISLSSVASISAIDFLFGSTEYSSSYSILGGGNYTLFGNLDIPSNFNSQNLSFNVTFSNGQSIASSSIPINIGQINFSLCSNIGSNLTYTNISFKNETTSLQNVNASISSTWTYRLGRGIVNKTYTFVNSTANRNYGFCFTPQNRSVIVDTTITYENAESPARTFGLSSTSLTNSSTLYTLYLLPSSLGIYTRYKTMTAGQQIITGAMATVYRTIGGSTFIVASGFTDSSGQIAFFLDPSISYDYTFSATSYGSSSFSLTPNSLETYTVILGSSTSSLNLGVANTLGSSNLTYFVTPNQSQLTNNTQYLFSFNLSGSDVTFVSMNISNSTLSQLYYQSSSTEGILSGLVNTGNNTRLYGYFTVITNNATIEFVKVWDVGNYYAGSYSLYTQLRLWNQYGFSDFTRILLVLIVLTSIMVYISYNDIVESSESKVAVALLLIWAFSLVGWLDTGLIANTNTDLETYNVLSRLANSYIIAIFSSIIGLGFIIRRLFQ